MIGRERRNFDSQRSFLQVQLASLTTETVQRAYRTFQQSGEGLAHFLLSFIVDCVKRKLSLVFIVEILRKAFSQHDSASSLRDFFLNLTSKDLFIAALEVTPEKFKSKLSYQYVGSGFPFPFYYELCDLESSIRSVTNFSALEDLLLVSNPQLVLSCGTASAVGCGKTSLLQKLIGAMKVSSVDVSLFDKSRSESPCHKRSADLIFDKSFTYADFHGYTDTLDFLRALTMLAIVSSLSLVHVSESDIDESKCVLKDEVRQFFAYCFSDSAARRSPIVVIVRDSARSAFCAPVQKDLKELLQSENVTVVNLPSLIAFPNETHQYRVIKKLTNIIEPYLTVTPTLASRSLRLPPLENLKKVYSQLSKRLSVSYVEHISSLGRTLLSTLNAFPRSISGKLASVVFPLANNKTRLVQAKKEEKSVRESITAANGKYDEEDLARNMLKQKQIEELSFTCQITEPVKLFASVVKDQDKKRLVEFQQYLEMWKRDDVKILHNKRWEVLKQIEDVKKGSGDISTLEKTVTKIDVRLAELDISIDTFWSEIMQLCDTQQSDGDRRLKSSARVKTGRRLEDQCGLNPNIAKNVYLDCVLDGYPMQLLQGNPLEMAGAFLKDVIASLDIDSAERGEILVVSVIGAQRSGKSTLLNYLFGCGFSTRSGRGTKGLYVSYMRTSGGQRLLILDSEGLLSIEGAGAGRDSDGQITIMAMACSHVVIINYKGEISSELKDLLEVGLNSMSHLGLTHIKPKLAFVLRDQRDRDVDVQTTSLQKLKSMLKEASQRSNMHFDDACIFLLPSAFSAIPKGEKSVEVPSTVFSQEIFELRKKIFLLAQEGSRMMNFVSPGKETGNALVDWYNHAALIWSTLTNFGYSLLYYKTLEIQINKDLTDIFNLVFATVFENEESGYKVKAERYLTELKQELDAVKDSHGVEKRHGSFKSKLNQLKDSVQRELVHLFKSQSRAERFKNLRPSFLLKFQSPLDREHDLYLFSAQLHVDQKTNDLDMASIDQHFLEEILKESRCKTGMSPEKASDVFEKVWMPLQEKLENTLSKNFPKDKEIRRNVILAFAAEVKSMQHSEKYILLTGAQTPSYVEGIDNFQVWQDKEWMRFTTKNHALFSWWKNRKYQVEALLAVKEMRSKVNSVVKELMFMLKHQNFGKLVCRTALELTVASVEYIENKSLEKHGLILARAEFIDKFYRCLQAVTIDELLREKRKELRVQRDKMARTKEHRRELLLRIVSTNPTYLKRAKLF